MKKRYKFMKKSEREKYTLITIAYYFFCVMLILLLQANLISTDIWGAIQGFFDIPSLLYMFFLLLPINITVFVSVHGIVIWFLNQTRYFAWPPDKMAHSVIQVSMTIAFFETLVSGGLGFDLNPLSHIYLYTLYPEEYLAFAARFFSFLTVIFVPYFLYSVRALDYNYPIGFLVGFQSAFLAAILGLFFIEFMGIDISATDLGGDMGQLTEFIAVALLYVAAFTVLHFVTAWYMKEHETAVKAGTVYIEPSWQKVHVFGYYWRPGMATESGNKRLLAILILILLGLIAMFVFTGMLKI